MRSALRRRIVTLERTLRTMRNDPGPVTACFFLAQVEERIRFTRESFQEAVQALVVQLEMMNSKS